MDDYKLFRNVDGTDQIFHCADGHPMVVNANDPTHTCKRCGLPHTQHDLPAAV